MEEGEDYIDVYDNAGNKPIVTYLHGDLYATFRTYKKTGNLFTYRSYEDVFMPYSPDNKINLIEDDGEYDEE